MGRIGDDDMDDNEDSSGKFNELIIYLSL